MSSNLTVDTLSTLSGIHSSVHNIWENTKRLYAESGLDLIGTFEGGCTVTNSSQVVLYAATGKGYSWDGAFNKVVIAGSSPDPISSGNWVDKTGDLLRSNLYGDTGLDLIRGKLLTTSITRSMHSIVSDFKFSVLNASNVIGDGINDDRLGIENLILTLSMLTNGATLYFPKGKYLLNSYSSNPILQAAFSQILPIRSNVHIELDDNAEIIVGPYFDDKNFTVFCGLDNGTTPSASTNTNNVHVYGGAISFSGSTSKMRTGYKLRIGFQFGKTSGTSVTGVTFKDGDLSNCIVAGYGTVGEFHTVRGCRFLNLVQDADTGSSPNIDFTACYCNAEKSRVIDCDFSNTSRRGGEIACAVELHKSFSEWRGGTIYGYTRGSFVVSTPSESTFTQGCIIDGIKGVVINQFVGLWIGAGCNVNNLTITNNVLRTKDRDGTMTDANYYGACGILSTAGRVGDTGSSSNINVKNNIFCVSPTVPEALSTILITTKNIQGWKVEDNIFQSKHLIFNDVAGTRIYTSVVIKNNQYHIDSMLTNTIFATIDVLRMIYCEVDLKLTGRIQLTHLLKINSVEGGTGNSIKIHDENTALMSTPANISSNYLAGTSNESEYPEDMTFYLPASAGVYPFNTNDARPYHKQATIIDKKTLPVSAAISGQLTPNAAGQMASLGYYPTNLGGTSYIARVRLSSFS